MSLLFRRGALRATVLGLAMCGQQAADYIYEYDPAGRLTAVREAGSFRLGYEHDPSGNILRQYIEPFTDTDQDHLPDPWEVQNFGNLSALGSADADSDGHSNLEEYVAGTDPRSAASVLRVISIDTTVVGDIEIRASTVPTRRYRLQWKNSLSDAEWQTDHEEKSGEAITTWLDTNPDTDMRFYRVVLIP